MNLVKLMTVILVCGICQMSKGGGGSGTRTLQPSQNIRKNLTDINVPENIQTAIKELDSPTLSASKVAYFVFNGKLTIIGLYGQEVRNQEIVIKNEDIPNIPFMIAKSFLQKNRPVSNIYHISPINSVQHRQGILQYIQLRKVIPLQQQTSQSCSMYEIDTTSGTSKEKITFTLFTGPMLLNKFPTP